jgi:predicted amidohydrolase YtcJ
MYNAGETRDDREGIRRMPPVVTGHKIGVSIGAGTDAHRVSTYNPFTVLQWFQDGKTAGGTPLRGRKRRRAALTRCGSTRSAARGSRTTKTYGVRSKSESEPTLAVLSKDYMTVPVDQIGGIESLLTMVDGKVVVCGRSLFTAATGSR